MSQESPDTNWPVSAAGPDPGPAPALSPDPAHAPAVDGYEVTGVLGEGGMGTVWRAVQLGTRREVALKVMSLAAFGSARARQRFDREVELTARLEHPHIARVYDSGVRRGLYYYAMELVDGVPPGEFVRRQGGDAARRAAVALELMRRVCLAVQHAHQRGVIHRDLKPSNVLVDAGGDPHVLDFGLAKPLATDPAATVAGGPPVSVQGEIAGTPAYMSPEQAAGRADALDVRTDVYSLGVMLFHLLTGQHPHDLSGTYLDVLRRVSEEDVRRPRRVSPGLDAELEALLLKALAREPDARYASAGALADDLDNYLRGEPLAARPPTTAYFLRKRLRKHRVPVAATAAGVAVLLAVAVLAYVRVAQERTNALASAADAAAKERTADAERARADEQSRAARAALASGLIAQGDALGSAGRWEEAADRYRAARDAYARLDLPTTAAELALWDAYRNTPPPPLTLKPHDALAVGVAVAPGGRTAVTMGWAGDVRVTDLPTGRTLRTFDHGRSGAYAFACSPDGRRALTGGADGTLRLWDVDTGTEVRTLSTARPAVASAAFLPDGRRAVTSGDGGLRLWDLDGGRVLRAFDGRAAGRTPAVSPDGRFVLCGGGPTDATFLSLWDVETGRVTRTFGGRRGAATAAAFSADGRRAAAGGEDGDVHVWDLATGRRVATLIGHRLPVRRVRFGRDAGTLFSADRDRGVVEWDVDAGREARVIGRAAPLFDFCLAPDGDALLTGSDDGRIRLWPLAESREGRALYGHRRPRDLDLAPDGLTALSAGEDGTIRQWDVVTARPLRTLLRLPDTPVSSVRFLPDGRRALSVSAGGALKLWDLETGRQRYTVPADHGAWHLAVSPDGRFAATTGGSVVQFWDVESGRPLAAAGEMPPGANTHAVALSPDGRTALTAGNDWYVRAWDVANCRRTDWPRLGGRVWGVDFSPDGALVATASGALTLWDAANGKPLRTIGGFTGDPRAVRFSPDASRLLSGTEDGRILLHAAADGRELRAWRGHDSRVTAICFARDGNLAASAGNDGAIRIWDFARVGAYQRFEAPVADALREGAPGAAALATLGEWYAFRGQWAWAADLLAEARDGGGAAVSSLTLARCAWGAGRIDDADREFAAAAARGEAPTGYVALCRGALAAYRTGEAQLAAGRDLEDLGRYDAAVDALTDAIRLRPGDLTALSRRATALVRLGRFTDALPDLDRVLKVSKADPSLWYRRACLRLYTGDVDGYRADCAEMSARFGADPGISTAAAEITAKVCLLLPPPDAELARLGDWADRAVATGANDPLLPWFKLTRGLTDYRRGRFAEAIAPLNDAAVSVNRPSGRAAARLLIALCEHRRGNAREAAAAMAMADGQVEGELSADRAADERVEDWLVWRILRREATQTLAPANP